MGAPIIVPNRRSPWEALLPQMLMQKMAHKQDLELQEAKTKTATALLKEKRTYTEGQDIVKSQRREDATKRTENRKAIAGANDAGFISAETEPEKYWEEQKSAISFKGTSDPNFGKIKMIGGKPFITL